MNTELIIKAVNAVIEFNSQNTDDYKMTAQVDVSKFHVACRVWWNWDGSVFDDQYQTYAYADKDLQQFIDKLQELSQ